MCVVVLVDKSREGCKFIAASLHNLNKDEHSNVNMAELFLQLLELLGDKMEYPVILAGDFNADIQERETSFTIPKYMRTLHRWNLNVIDFFLCRPGRNATVVLDNVEADLAHDVKNADQMVELDKVSNHDPLRATLQLSVTKATTKSSTAAAITSKGPTSSKLVVKKTMVKTSLLATSKTTDSTHIKQEAATVPKPKSAPGETVAKKTTTKPSPSTAKGKGSIKTVRK